MPKIVLKDPNMNVLELVITTLPGKLRLFLYPLEVGADALQNGLSKQHAPKRRSQRQHHKAVFVVTTQAIGRVGNAGCESDPGNQACKKSNALHCIAPCRSWSMSATGLLVFFMFLCL